MAGKTKMTALLIVYACSQISLVSAVVPLLIWGQEEVKQIKPMVGHSYSNEDLKSVLDTLSNNDLYVFLQDKLSVEDFTKYSDAYRTDTDGAVFHNIKNLMSQHASVHLPRTSSPLDALSAYKDAYTGRVHEIYSPQSLSGIPLEKDTHNLVIVHLPETSTDARASLSESDKLIGNLMTEAKARGQAFNAIYTAKDSSKVEPRSLYMGRHLLADTDDKHFYNVSNCIYFYSEKIILQMADVKDNNTWVLPPGDSSTSKCNGNETILIVTFTEPAAFKKLSMMVTFAKTQDGYWMIKTWNLTSQLQAQSNETVSIFSTSEYYAPLLFSYHCTDAVLKTGAVTITMKDMQTQAYNITNGQFGTANDCIGFFTAPIWSGIITGVVLISILTFGIYLLSNINTMDRFDDPKGKTILVTVGE